MLKVDFINKAYSMGKISGLTSNPTPEEKELALDRLESMAAEWYEQTLCTGYNFESSPDLNTAHNVPRAYWAAFESCLMMRLLADFGKQASPELAANMRTAFSRMSSSLACVRQVTQPSRMPIGSGNRRWRTFNNFYPPVAKTPIGCNTKKMVVDDTNDFVEDFSAYLVVNEDLASFTIEADTGLTIDSSALYPATPSDSTQVNYTITADGGTDDYKTPYQVKIVATTSEGRVETRLVNFELTEVEL